MGVISSAMTIHDMLPRTHFSQVVKFSSFSAALIRAGCSFGHTSKACDFVRIYLYRSRRCRIMPLTQDGLRWSGGVIFLNLPWLGLR